MKLNLKQKVRNKNKLVIWRDTKIRLYDALKAEIDGYDLWRQTIGPNAEALGGILTEEDRRLRVIWPKE